MAVGAKILLDIGADQGVAYSMGRQLQLLHHKYTPLPPQSPHDIRTIYDANGGRASMALEILSIKSFLYAYLPIYRQIVPILDL